MSLVERVRATGTCPPSLLKQEEAAEGDKSFEEVALKILDANGLSIAPSGDHLENFKTLLQMCESIDQVSSDSEEVKKLVVARRRCVILAIVGATPPSNSSLANILQSGFLSTVKLWLDDILNGSIGGVDLLLHLLSNIKNLPVTKAIVKDSGMGKAVGAIEKHSICSGTPNETNIKDRVEGIKDAWKESVKVLKERDSDSANKKREVDPSSLAPAPKKQKTEEKSSKPSFSSLMNKMSDSSGAPGSDAAEDGPAKKKDPKKSSKRVKWADHFGGNLSAAKIIDGEELTEPVDGAPAATSAEGNVSWSDRKKRDRLREKELLAKAKKSKLMDDDEDMGTTPEPPSTPATGIRPTISWHTPAKLPDRTDVTPPTVASVERQIQSTRMSSVTEARYASDFDIPKSPAPMTDVEQALDMTSQASAMTASIPFFVPAPTPAQAPAAAPAPTPAPAPAYDFSQPPAAHTPPATTAAPPQTGSVPATAETVQALGLPMFLVGQNVQALQTLASTPSLLSTFVDSSGMYDQTRLMSLVQTLSQNIPPAPAPAAPAAAPPMGGYQPYQQQSTSSYGPPGGQQQSYQSGNTSAGMYGPASTSTYGPAGGSGGWNSGGMRPSNGYRGDGNTEGNLHLSGYGPMTTQADIIQLFAPYVQVDEVVMKQNFSFVNTSNPVGAQQAREALNGALLGGQPVRINVATRKKKEPMPPYGGGGNNAPSMYGNAGMGSSISTQPPPANPYGAPPAAAPPAMGGMQPAGMGGMPQQDPSTVRDDRGNPATKNLFVAGYGPGTTEMQIRELFGQYANIVGIIVKGTFSFVNTSDRSMAVAARAALGGTMMNGGVLRINFAKETGRLGTSFDLGYSNAGGTRGPPGGPPPPSHYGRSY